MKNASQIATIINEIYDGVERSKVGKIIKTNQKGIQELNNLPFNVFMNILSALIPKEINSKVTHEVDNE